MNIVFMGTPDFAVPCLESLLDNGFNVKAVVTQPDRPKGRGNKLTPPPVKVLAQKNGIPVYQPDKVKSEEFVNVLRGIKPDLIVVVAFGQILSKTILDIPPLGCINVHASLLPKYRGAAPINWCIINGEKITGITTMYMNEGLDTGDIIIKNEIKIEEEDTSVELHDKMAFLGASTLIETLELIKSGKMQRIPQDDSQATYAPMLTKALGRIDWSGDAESIRNLIRGTLPWPAAYSNYKGKSFKIFKAEALNSNLSNEDYGKIIEVFEDSIIVSCRKGQLKIIELQFENEKRMSVEAYLRGHNIEKGTILE